MHIMHIRILLSDLVLFQARICSLQSCGVEAIPNIIRILHSDSHDERFEYY